jgi:ATP-dependent DNA helicase RecQ
MTSFGKFFPEFPILREYQAKSIERILNKKNILTIAPAGSGRSLIFQLSAIELEGTAIVISPPDALIEEHFYDMKDHGISTLLVNSDIPFEKQRKIMRDSRSHKPKLLYVSPDILSNYYFRSSLRLNDLKISMVVIDEAHCISQWGMNYRPDYSNIKPFINYLYEYGNGPIIVALTAALGEKAREEIRERFEISNCDEIIDNSIIKDNVILNFKEVDDEEEKWNRMRRFIDNNHLKKVLVYLNSRKKCESFSQKYSNSSKFFHTGLSIDERRAILNEFKVGGIKVLFATTAFGMGVNIPDIDGVIHCQIPGSVEEYYQHVGRGARNKLVCPECKCLFLWSKTNFDREKCNIQGDTMTKEKVLYGYKQLGLLNNHGKNKHIPWEEIFKNDGSCRSVDLAQLLGLFIKHGICSIVGDICGNPYDIPFKRITSFWEDLLYKLEGRNQFTVAERRTGKTIQQMIDHVYEQEMAGNLLSLPEKNRLLFLHPYFDDVPESKLTDMISESESVEAFKLDQLHQLRGLCDCNNNNAHKYIAEILGIPYQ